MRTSRFSRALCVFLSSTTLLFGVPLPLLAQTAPPTPPAQTSPPATPGQQNPSASLDVDASIERSRELLKDGKYDDAIQLLLAAINQSSQRTDQLKEAYLLLIKSYVMDGNYLASLANQGEMSHLARKEAKTRVAECLQIKQFRHLRPEPESDYPEDMPRLFNEVRAEQFGSFRVVGLVPPSATVLLDADTLKTHADGTIGDVDIPIGLHNVSIQHAGFRTLKDAITITPGSNIERPYKLMGNHGGLWYATRGGAVAVLTGVVIAITGHKATAAQTKPLSDPPPPPGGH